MNFLLDTNTFSDVMVGVPKMLARLGSVVPPDEVVTCSIVRGEILHGIYQLAQGRRRSDLEQKSRKVFAVVPCIPVPADAADSYATLKIECRRTGIALDENDLWIAATSIALGAVLVTRDKDFSRIAAVRVQDWSA